LIKVEDY